MRCNRKKNKCYNNDYSYFIVPWELYEIVLDINNEINLYLTLVLFHRERDDGDLTTSDCARDWLHGDEGDCGGARWRAEGFAVGREAGGGLRCDERFRQCG